MNRSADLEPLLSIEPNYSKFLPGWGLPEQLSESEYIELLQETIFVPCPPGINTECFRYYEALENGCIPVFLEKPAILEKSKIPFIKCSSWSDVVNVIEGFIKNPTIMEDYSKSLQAGWLKYKDQLKDEVSQWVKLNS